MLRISSAPETEVNKYSYFSKFTFFGVGDYKTLAIQLVFNCHKYKSILKNLGDIDSKFELLLIKSCAEVMILFQNRNNRLELIGAQSLSSKLLWSLCTIYFGAAKFS